MARHLYLLLTRTYLSAASASAATSFKLDDEYEKPQANLTNDKTLRRGGLPHFLRRACEHGSAWTSSIAALSE